MTASRTLGNGLWPALLDSAVRAVLDRLLDTLLGRVPQSAAASEPRDPRRNRRRHTANKENPENPENPDNTENPENKMNINVTIDTMAARAEVLAATAYAVAKTKDSADDWDRLAASEADMDLLDSYWNEAVRAMARNLRDHVTSTATESGTLTVGLEVSGDFNRQLTAHLGDGLCSYLVHTVVARWQSMVGDSDRAVAETAEAEAAMTGVKALLAYRQRPVRRLRVES